MDRFVQVRFQKACEMNSKQPSIGSFVHNENSRKKRADIGTHNLQSSIGTVELSPYV